MYIEKSISYHWALALLVTFIILLILIIFGCRWVYKLKKELAREEKELARLKKQKELCRKLDEILEKYLKEYSVNESERKNI